MSDLSSETVVGNDCYCGACGHLKESVSCWSCGGEGYHDLYEDDPLWYDEDDIEHCDVCNGKGFYYVCAGCYPESVDEYV